MYHHLGSLVLGGIVMALLSACSTAGMRDTSRAQSPTTDGTAAAFKPGDIVETQTGNIISFPTLLDELADADLIYVGETHTSVEDHRIQLEILKGLHERNPSSILAMEMFPKTVQPALDRYSEGVIDESDMLEQTDWNTVWGYPFQLYGSILSFARDNRLEMIALNAPPGIVKKVSHDGLTSLSSEERSQLAAHFHMDDPRHREYVREEYEQHIKEGIKDFDSFYEAQLAWEETMAETLAKTLAASQSGTQIIVLVGAGHIVNHMGIPRWTSLRIEHTSRTVIPQPAGNAAQAVQEKAGDYVWVTKEPEDHHKGRFGIMVRPASSGDGLEIFAVLPGGPAAKAGVQKGDVLFMLDGSPVNNVEEIHKALKRGSPEHRLRIKRNGNDIEMDVIVPR